MEAGRGALSTMSKTPTLVRESSSVDESLTQEDARRFWKQHFGEVEKSSWETFAAALSREFVFAKSDIDRIKEVLPVAGAPHRATPCPARVLSFCWSAQGMDTDGDGTITLEEFNDFTLKVRLRCTPCVWAMLRSREAGRARCAYLDGSNLKSVRARVLFRRTERFVEQSLNPKLRPAATGMAPARTHGAAHSAQEVGVRCVRTGRKAITGETARDPTGRAGAGAAEADARANSAPQAVAACLPVCARCAMAGGCAEGQDFDLAARQRSAGDKSGGSGAESGRLCHAARRVCAFCLDL